MSTLASPLDPRWRLPNVDPTPSSGADLAVRVVLAEYKYEPLVIDTAY